MNYVAFLANFSFLSLFISMFIYWIDSSNLNLASSQKIKVFGYEFKYSLSSFGNIGIFSSNICLFLLLCVRWRDSGHFPLSNLYESLMFLSWALTFIHLVLNFDFLTLQNQKKLGLAGTIDTILSIKDENSKPDNKKKILNKLIGSIIAPSALFTNAFASFSLPIEMQNSGPLVPALQSNWLMMHVTVMILSYAALIIGSLLSIGFLVISPNKNLNEATLEISSSISLSNVKNIKEQELFNLSKILDNLSYRVLGLGFPLLTIGILSGAVWANEAWGTYWSWDPKETWALLTWLVFAIYLHTRLNKGWEGKKPALIASFGFVTVWICFLGVNLIGEGLHSYGWLSNQI